MDLEHFNFGYSLKNIPIPSAKHYINRFIEELDSSTRVIQKSPYTENVVFICIKQFH